MKSLVSAALLLFLTIEPAMAQDLNPVRDEMSGAFDRADERFTQDREQFLQDGLDALEKASRAMDQVREGMARLPTVDAAARLGATREGTSLDALFERYESARAAHASPDEETDALMLFVSFSMPEDVIREYSRQANAAGATLVLRGNYQGQTVRKTTEVAQYLNVGGAGWIINPELYTGYKVDAVPALVLSRTNLEADAEGCFPVGSYAAVFGEISIIGSLERIARDASDPVIRALAHERLSAIHGS